MFLTVDTNDARPIYRQVADGIKELIAHGALAEGAALPALRQLASDLGVNLNTIATAYRELQDAGLIVVKHGSGAVVASRRSAERSEDDLIKPLRAAITDLVLSGFTATRIQTIVQRELKLSTKETK